MTESLAPALDADAHARERIRTDLGRNLLVEAGAGSGKTTELVHRMLALIESGVGVERVAAVTFTRKAAGELGRRFRDGLEKRLRDASDDPDRSAVLERALRDIDRGFVGTIHAFCARLLRERPLAAGIDPGFEELGAVEERQLQDEFWNRWLDEMHAREDPLLARLAAVAIQPRELMGAFRRTVELADVAFDAPEAEVPASEELRDELERLLEQAMGLMPPQPLHGKTDRLRQMTRRLSFLRNTSDWSRPAAFFAALETMRAPKQLVTLQEWAQEPAGKAAVKSLGVRWRAFVDGPAAQALDGWYAHRYSIVLGFLLRLRDEFRVHRWAAGRLTFNDLLLLAAHLLREDPEARRELGRRYPYLLVDEFQDTDPLQAEICLLLASDPAEGRDWRQVRPRPGALFVVGDPKQSIYRFRRADIQIYNAVRDRILATGGEKLELTRNFRSVTAIGRFVDAVFVNRFRAEPTEEQAAFAPLNARREAPGGGVFRYQIETEGSSKEIIGAFDARVVAAWIEDQIREHHRKPADFLVIPYRREALAFYARELERRDVPVTTTGAGLTADTELRELLALIEAIADPANELWTIAVLTGLFFGLDPSELLRHRRADGRFSGRGRAGTGTPTVNAALAQLGEWSDLCRVWPVDAALTRIVAEIGLIPMAAGGEMGESRAGSLVHALDVVAAAVARGASDLRSAIKAIEAVRDSPDVEAPLRPGRADAVRIMNLHKAKGLESKVVVLAYPTGLPRIDPDAHVERLGGVPRGWFQVVEQRTRHEKRVRARPAGWEALAGDERRFLEAERFRLLYVAITRARDQLVVGECAQSADKSPWGPLHQPLLEHSSLLRIPVREPDERARPTTTPAEAQARTAEVDAARATAAMPAYEFVSVTADEEQAEGEDFLFQGPDGKGREWGTIVHRALATMGRGRPPTSLRGYCRGLLRSAGRPVDDAGEPLELEELMSLLGRVRESDAWKEVEAGPEPRWELTLTRLEAGDEGPRRLVSGTVDALNLGGSGAPARLVDWKTDVAPEEQWAVREVRYRRQVEAYRRMVRELSGVDAQATVERVAVPS